MLDGITAAAMIGMAACGLGLVLKRVLETGRSVLKNSLMIHAIAKTVECSTCLATWTTFGVTVVWWGFSASSHDVSWQIYFHVALVWLASLTVTRVVLQHQKATDTEIVMAEATAPMASALEATLKLDLAEVPPLVGTMRGDRN